MTVYIVTRIADGVEVYRYDADAPVEWPGMEFGAHAHTAAPAPQEPEPPHVDPDDWRIGVGAFFDRFGAQKWPILASTDPMVQALIRDVSVRDSVRLVERRAELNMALDMLIAKGYKVDKAAILDVQPGPEEIARG